jgi:hypothetical protein
MGAGAPTGRPAQYCRRSCRQRAYEDRRQRRERDALETLIRDARAERDRLADDWAHLKAIVADVSGLEGSDEVDRDLESIEARTALRALRTVLTSENAGNPRSVKFSEEVPLPDR